MSFGGKGSSFQWEKGTTSRQAPQRLQMPYDQLVRGLIGQMAQPPETAISTPLQQAMSNLQSGDPGRVFGIEKAGGSLASRLMGGGDTGTGGSTASSGTSGGGNAPGFAPGSFSADAAGGQQGLQTREQLGLPDRSSYFPFMPSKEDIEAIGLSPVRSGIKGKDQLTGRIGRLQDRIDAREALGLGHEKASKRLDKAQATLKKRTGATYD